MSRLSRLLTEHRSTLIVVGVVLCLAIVLGVVGAHANVFDPHADESGLDWTPSGNASDSERVTDDVTTFMATLQDPADNDLDSVIAKLTKTQRLAIDLVGDHGVNIPDLCQRLFSTAAYSIGSVSVEGDKATVEMTMTHKPFGRLANAANSDFRALLDSSEGDELTSQGVDALLGRYEQVYLEHLDSSSELVSDSFTVGLTKTNGTWTIDNASVVEMAKTLVEGVDLPIDL